MAASRSGAVFVLTKKQADFRAGAGTRTDYYTTTAPAGTVHDSAHRLSGRDHRPDADHHPIRRDGLTIHPQAAIYGHNGYTVDAVGSGSPIRWRKGRASPSPARTSTRSLASTRIPLQRRAVQDHGMGHREPRHAGADGARQPGVPPADRPLTLGASASWAQGKWGVSQNYFGPSYTWATGSITEPCTTSPASTRRRHRSSPRRWVTSRTSMPTNTG